MPTSRADTPCAFHRQHSYLLNYQHISTGTNKQFRVAQRISNTYLMSRHPPTRRSNPTSFQSPIHDCASKIPSITRLNVDSPSTANQHVKDIHSQNSNQGSSTALRRASGRFPKSSWTDDSRRGSLIQAADRRRLLNARGRGDLSPVEIIVNVDKDSLAIKECPFQTARWLRQKNSGAMQKVLVRKP